jgi:phosphoribosylanthranilate isomerase
MSRVRVKICGITSPKDLLTAVEAGADAVGFIVDVPQSPRDLSIDEAGKLIEATPIFVDTVVVTVPTDVSHLEKICEESKADIIQVHGSSHLYREIRERLPDACLICGVQARSKVTTDTIIQAAANLFNAVLIDSHVPGKYGGTGTTHDWELSRRIRELIHPKPLILAGGLRPENVSEAIRMVKPFAVDVSTGVESRPGVKDRKKVFEFIRNAQEAEIS